MKLLLALTIALALIAQAYTATCLATKYCMTCSTTSTCTSCFNWGSGKVGARSLASATCTAALTKTVTNARTYSGTFTSTSTWAWGSATCKSGKYFIADTSVATPTASCSKTLPTGGVAVTNCEYANFDKTSATAATAYCALCKKNLAGNAGMTACTGTAITNCEQAAGSNCHYCKSKFAASSARTACTAFTTDGNCRGLATGNTACDTCWDAYYFNGTTCKLFASILSASFAIYMALIQ